MLVKLNRPVCYQFLNSEEFKKILVYLNFSWIWALRSAALALKYCIGRIYLSNGFAIFHPSLSLPYHGKGLNVL